MPRVLTDHRFAEIFPLMEGEDFERLVADIRENGQVEPITVMNGMILDGRNRYRACQEIGIEPEVLEYDGDSPLAFVLSLNLYRRHLSASQRAMVAGKLANLGQGRPSDDKQANLPVSETASEIKFSQEHAATYLNVSPRSVKDARLVHLKADPEITKAVENNTVAVSAAAQVARLPMAEQKALISAGPDAIADKARELREAKKAPEPAPASNVVSLAGRQPALPQFGDLDREIDADQARQESLEAGEEDVESVNGRAHAFNGALSTLDYIAITGREYWSVFDKDPAKTVYLQRVRVAHEKLSDILKEANNVPSINESHAASQRKGSSRRGQKSGSDRL
jgi:ParB-like chromosome segregation protein Spo0J